MSAVPEGRTYSPTTSGIYLDEAGFLTVQIRGQIETFEMSPTEMRKLAERLAETALRVELRS